MPIPPLNQFKPMSFNGVEFPYDSYTVAGGIRRHKHEFPHSPGAAVEKLGRELYEISVSVNFTGGLIAPRYNDLLLSLAVLRDAFENEITAELNIPHIGTIQACADHWRETATGRNRSTIRGELTFYEDLNSAVALQNTVTVSPAAMASLLDQFNIERAGITPAPVPSSFQITPIGPNSVNIFDAISDLTTSILGIKDQQELFGALVSSKINGLVALFKAADTLVPELNEPKHYKMLDAMHALWEAALKLQNDLQNTGFEARLYVTPKRMGIADVCVAIYGNTRSAAQLMQMNDLRDPLSIPPNSQIIYYPALAA
jgi:hypothetical protein